MTARFLIAAGGTGGHMFPAMAVAAELRGRGNRVTLLTDTRGSRYIKNDPDCRIIEAASPSGGLTRRIRGLVLLAKGFWQSWRQIGQTSPAAIATFGGYASAPAAIAAILRRVPLLIHEQNAVLGKANRLVARFASSVALSFERTTAVPASAGVEKFLAGNPVRPDFRARPAEIKDGKLRLLVLGGSQGARVLSDAVPGAIAKLAPDLRARLEIAQQCRPEDLERVRSAYGAISQLVTLASFFDNVPELMSKADLVVSRSGASTVAELLALGKPSVLIPYQFAADDHQTANAAALATKGAAITIPQADVDADRLSNVLAEVLGDPLRLGSMARAAAAMARPDAASLLADRLTAMAKRRVRP